MLRQAPMWGTRPWVLGAGPIEPCQCVAPSRDAQPDWVHAGGGQGAVQRCGALAQGDLGTTRQLVRGGLGTWGWWGLVWLRNPSRVDLSTVYKF